MTFSKTPFSISISTGARGSPLSRTQVAEVQLELNSIHPGIQLIPEWITTTGDIDKKTPLSEVYKEDFFTKEIDELQLAGRFKISIHSAKDLPKTLRKGLEIVAITRGVDPRDVLVLPEGYSYDTLPNNARIGTSSKRREDAIRTMRPDFIPTQIRGNIQERLQLLNENAVDALIMAEAALIRLQLTHLNRIYLDIEPEPLQGKLAVIAREGDREMKELFQAIDSR